MSTEIQCSISYSLSTIRMRALGFLGRWWSNMPRVSLLPIDDGIVSPHLQLLRQVCEPSSTSRPHVTIRYFERLRVPEEYGLIRVTHIDLIEPGMFALKTNGFHYSGGGENQ